MGVVLAGDFTNGALTQLKSLGFGVLYFPYETVVKAFSKFGINAAFDEKTAEADFRKKLIVGINFQTKQMSPKSC